MITLITLTSKNQMTLPVAFVKKLGLKKGQKLWTKIEDNKIVIDKADSWRDVQGIAANTAAAKKYTTEQLIETAKIKGTKERMKKWKKFS